MAEIDRQIELAVIDGLAELAALEQQREQIAAPYEWNISELEIKMKAATAAIDYAIEQARAGIKKGVLVLEHTVTGERVQAVYVKERVSWNDDALRGYAAGNPEILAFRNPGEPSVSFRMVKEKAKPFLS